MGRHFQVRARSARNAAARAGLGKAAPRRRGGDALPPRPLIHRSPMGVRSTVAPLPTPDSCVHHRKGFDNQTARP